MRRAKSRRSTAPAGAADEAGPRWDDDARLQTPRHHHVVRGSQHPRRHCHRPQHAASPPSGVRRFLNTIEAQVPVGKVIHAVVDNYATTNTRGCADGWPVTALDLPLHPTSASGLTPLKASSPSSHASGSSAASSNLSSNCNSRSTASWPRPTPIPNPSSGPPTPNASSPPSSGGSKCWSQSTSVPLVQKSAFGLAAEMMRTSEPPHWGSITTSEIAPERLFVASVRAATAQSPVSRPARSKMTQQRPGSVPGMATAGRTSPRLRTDAENAWLDHAYLPRHFGVHPGNPGLKRRI